MFREHVWGGSGVEKGILLLQGRFYITRLEIAIWPLQSQWATQNLAMSWPNLSLSHRPCFQEITHLHRLFLITCLKFAMNPKLTKPISENIGHAIGKQFKCISFVLRYIFYFYRRHHRSRTLMASTVGHLTWVRFFKSSLFFNTISM